WRSARRPAYRTPRAPRAKAAERAARAPGLGLVRHASACAARHARRLQRSTYVSPLVMLVKTTAAPSGTSAAAPGQPYAAVVSANSTNASWHAVLILLIAAGSPRIGSIS